ncbi:MAG: hypothetical protein VX777_05685 [Chlamydiota bacterium]|nr:hypothetical protein [Chlamydiota bacterium]
MGPTTAINPNKQQYHSCRDFRSLKSWQQFITLMVTAIVTPLSLFIAMVPVYRALVGRFNKVNLIKANKMTKETNDLAIKKLGPQKQKIEDVEDEDDCILGDVFNEFFGVSNDGTNEFILADIFNEFFGTSTGDENCTSAESDIVIPINDQLDNQGTVETNDSVGRLPSGYRVSKPQVFILKNHVIGGFTLNGRVRLRGLVDEDGKKIVSINFAGDQICSNGQKTSLSFEQTVDFSSFMDLIRSNDVFSTDTVDAFLKKEISAQEKPVEEIEEQQLSSLDEQLHQTAITEETQIQKLCDHLQKKIVQSILNPSIRFGSSFDDIGLHSKKQIVKVSHENALGLPGGKCKISQPETYAVNNYQLGNKVAFKGTIETCKLTYDNREEFGLVKVDGFSVSSTGQKERIVLEQIIPLDQLESSKSIIEHVQEIFGTHTQCLEAPAQKLAIMPAKDKEGLPEVVAPMPNNLKIELKRNRQIVTVIEGNSLKVPAGNYEVSQSEVYEVNNYLLGNEKVSGTVKIGRLVNGRGMQYGLVEIEGWRVSSIGNRKPIAIVQIIDLNALQDPKVIGEQIAGIVGSFEAQIGSSGDKLPLEAPMQPLPVTPVELLNSMGSKITRRMSSEYIEALKAEEEKSRMNELIESSLLKAEEEVEDSIDEIKKFLCDSNNNIFTLACSQEFQDIKESITKPIDELQCKVESFDGENSVTLEGLYSEDSESLTDLSGSWCIPSDKRVPADDFEIVSRRKTLIEGKERILSLKGNEACLGKPSFNLIGDLCNIQSFDDLSDDTLLRYNDYGCLVPFLNKDDVESSEKTLAIFKEALDTTYGTMFGDLLFNRYFRNHKRDVTLKRLTYGELKKVFVGAATLAGDKELRELFEAMKQNKLDSEMLCGRLLPKYIVELICVKKSFEDLDTADLQLLRSCFNTILDKDSKYVPTFIGVLEGANLRPESNQFDYFLHDAELLSKLYQHMFLEEEDIRLSISEHLGKKIVYSELRKGMIIPLLNENFKECLYKVEGYTAKEGDGFSANLITPVNTNVNNKFRVGENETTDIFLSLRGTCPEPQQEDALMTIFRDLQSGGVGADTFNRRANDIATLVEDYLSKPETPNNTTITIAGHSLGGCDAQRALLVLMEKIDQSDENSPWRKVKHLILISHNAPKLEEGLLIKTISKMNKIHNSLEEKVKKGELELDIDVTHVRFFDKCTEDIVGWFGDMLAGAKIGDSKIFTKRVIKVYLDSEEGLAGHATGILPRHTSKVFSVPPSVKAREYQERKVIDQGEELEKLLACNHHWVDLSEKQIKEQLMQYAAWYAGYAYKLPRDGFHYGLNYALLKPCSSLVRFAIGCRAKQQQGWEQRLCPQN